MTPKEQFVATVVNSLNRLRGPMPNELDNKLEQRMLGKFFDRGFTVNDAVGYCNCTEERNPDLEESVALSKMAIIQKKYPPVDYSI